MRQVRTRLFKYPKSAAGDDESADCLLIEFFVSSPQFTNFLFVHSSPLDTLRSHSLHVVADALLGNGSN